MKLLSLSIAFALVSCPIFCTQYASINFGTDNLVLTNQDHNPKVGYKLGATYGHTLDYGFRSEVEVSYAKSSYKTKYNLIDCDIVQSKEYRSYYSWSYMANVIYDAKELKFNSLTPFLGLGAGYSENTEKNKIKTATTTSKDKFSDGRFAYQIIAGMNYQLNDNYSTALEYHYFAGKSHAKSHRVGLSVIRNF